MHLSCAPKGFVRRGCAPRIGPIPAAQPQKVEPLELHNLLLSWICAFLRSTTSAQRPGFLKIAFEKCEKPSTVEGVKTESAEILTLFGRVERESAESLNPLGGQIKIEKFPSSN